MENEQAFEADADIGAFESLNSLSRQRSPNQGRDTMKAAFGTFGPQDENTSETTPLIARQDGHTQNDGEGTGDRADDDRGPPTWDGERDFEGRPWWNKPSVFWLLPPFTLFAMAFGGIIVPRLNLILSLICRQYCSDRSLHDPTFHMMPVILGSENPQCRVPEVQALVSKFTLYVSLIAGILAAITSPKLGALSDSYGRTRIMCFTTFLLMIGEILTILVAKYPDTLSVNWILVGAVFDGLGGTFIAAMAVSYAYASDCTVPERRNVVFGYYQGSLFTGIALGPILAGFIVKATGDILTVFYISFALHASFFLFLLLVVPESLTKERQLKARDKAKIKSSVAVSFNQESRTRFSTIIHLLRGSNPFAPLAILWPKDPGTHPAVRYNLALIAAVDATMFGVAMGSMYVILLYSEYAFGWDTLETSVYVSIVNISRVITLLVIVPIVTRVLRGPVSGRIKRNSGCDKVDLGFIRTAVLFDLLGYLGFTLVRSGNLFILSGALAALGGMGSPALQAALTKHVPPDRTGQVLGAMGLLHAVARVVAPAIFNSIYAATVGKFTQTVFVCLTSTFGLAFCLSWFIKPGVYWDEVHEPALNHDTREDSE